MSGVCNQPVLKGPCAKRESEVGAADPRAHHSINCGGGCPYGLSEACGGHSLRVLLLFLPTLCLCDAEKILHCGSSHLAHFINTEISLKSKTTSRDLANNSVVFHKHLQVSLISAHAAVAARNLVSVQPDLPTCALLFLPSSQHKTTDSVSHLAWHHCHN